MFSTYLRSGSGMIRSSLILPPDLPKSRSLGGRLATFVTGTLNTSSKESSGISAESVVRPETVGLIPIV